jgi:Rieske Fe-S protein
MSLPIVTAAIGACSNTNAPSGFPELRTVGAPNNGGVVTLPIDANSGLSSVGNAVRVVAPDTANFLVARTGQETFSAVTAECTHVACQITTFQGGTYECPCHGSQFNTGGGVVRGPAERQLRQFATRFANDTLTITVA